MPSSNMLGLYMFVVVQYLSGSVYCSSILRIFESHTPPTIMLSLHNTTENSTSMKLQWTDTGEPKDVNILSWSQTTTGTIIRSKVLTLTSLVKIPLFWVHNHTSGIKFVQCQWRLYGAVWSASVNWFSVLPVEVKDSLCMQKHALLLSFWFFS